ncbi:ABC transporter substrate-binding protein [Peribacillus simplex]|uniref:ABC transporter substrate-binding protein n=1 Tax=Peribacillus simplex TaxID=1478 RepID=A0A8B5Y5P0_9BACI|nr:ABC transporter substrate-binding protein [Peribacillus simplex]
MKMTRQALFLAWIGALLVLAGCSAGQAVEKNKDGYEKVELKYQGYAGVVTYPELAEDLGYLGPIKLNWVGNVNGGPQDIQTAATGQTDFGGAFNGAIIKLKSSGAPIKAVLGYYGSDEETFVGYYTLEGSSIKDARDLIGKKIGVNTLGAHFELVLKEYLKQNGLTDDEIKQVTLVVVPPGNAEQTLRQKQIDVVALNGAARDRALDNGGLSKVFSDYDLFGTFTAGSIVFTEKFIKENPNTVKKFVEGTAKAIEWSRITPREEVIARFESIIEKRDRKEDSETVQYWKSPGVAAKGGYIKESEFQVWADWLAENGEIKKDQVKLDDLYTNEFNPFTKEFETK